MHPSCIRKEQLHGLSADALTRVYRSIPAFLNGPATSPSNCQRRAEASASSAALSIGSTTAKTHWGFDIKQRKTIISSLHSQLSPRSLSHGDMQSVNSGSLHGTTILDPLRSKRHRLFVSLSPPFPLEHLGRVLPVDDATFWPPPTPHRLGAIGGPCWSGLGVVIE